MIGTNRTNSLKRLFKDEISNLCYEVYKGNDELMRIRTYAILDDGFNTRIKLEELGVYSESLERELNNSGYSSLDLNINKKTLTK